MIPDNVTFGCPRHGPPAEGVRNMTIRKVMNRRFDGSLALKSIPCRFPYEGSPNACPYRLVILWR